MKRVFCELFPEISDLFFVNDLDEHLFTISNKDVDVAIRGSLDKDRLSPKWKKVNYFRQCAAMGKQLLTNEPYFLSRDNSNMRVSLAKDFREWQLLNTINLPLIYNDFIGWQREVVSWYNLKISRGVENFSEQLYVWGDSPEKDRFFKHLFGKYFLFLFQFSKIINFIF